MFFLWKNPIYYKLWFLHTTLADPGPVAGAETLIYRLRSKVSAPSSSGSTTLNLLVFLCRRVNSDLAGISLPQESIKTNCDGVIQTIAKDKFANAFQR
jgi:hypothetical protein